jgi:DNA-binding NarL/FixJ family response regulator
MASGERKPKDRSMTVLLVDDHPLFREGLRQLLRDLDEGAEVLAEEDAEDGLAVAKLRDDLDLVCLDLTMPGMNGLAAVEHFVQEAPGVPVVIISGHEEPARVRRALALGAVGYIPKSTSASVMADALRLVLGGGVYVPPLMLADAQPESVASTRHPGSPEPTGEHLTERQVNVLELLALGKSNKVIARELDVSEKTVKSHITAVFRALGVVNRTQAAMEARKRGLIA